MAPGGDLHPLDADSLWRRLRTVPAALYPALWVAGRAGSERAAHGTAEYLHTAEAEGVRIARIGLRAHIVSSSRLHEPLEYVAEWVECLDLGSHSGFPIGVRQVLDVEGELRWDLEARRAHSLDLSGSVETVVTIHASESGDLTLVLRGGCRIQVEATEVDG
jgi:hypothetical protein